MVASIVSRPFVVHEVTRTPVGETRSLSWFELRTVGLSVAANLLHVPIADLDCVRAASNLADLESCPACGPHPRRSA